MRLLPHRRRVLWTLVRAGQFVRCEVAPHPFGVRTPLPGQWQAPPELASSRTATRSRRPRPSPGARACSCAGWRATDRPQRRPRPRRLLARVAPVPPATLAGCAWQVVRTSRWLSSASASISSQTARPTSSASWTGSPSTPPPTRAPPRSSSTSAHVIALRGGSARGPRRITVRGWFPSGSEGLSADKMVAFTDERPAVTLNLPLELELPERSGPTSSTCWCDDALLTAITLDVQQR